MTTPTSVFVSGPKEDKNVTLAKQNLGVTDLIYDFCILNFDYNVCLMLKLARHMLLVCVCVCVCVRACVHACTHYMLVYAASIYMWVYIHIYIYPALPGQYRLKSYNITTYIGKPPFG